MVAVNAGTEYSSKLTERHVQAIWYDALLRPPNLTTRDGKAVSVISPGEWNLGAGPDFRNAVLEIGSERVRATGDIEVHLCPADWDFHGHGSDPAYRNVIAHVTWRCGADPRTLPSGAISIWLGRFMARNAAFSPEQIDLAAYPYARLPEDARPCAERLAHDPQLAHKVLEKAGRHRLRMKARRLAGRIAERCACRKSAAPEICRQVFYEEVMSAFGYVRNTEGFRHVAERVPIAVLPADTPSAQMAMITAGGFEEWHRGSARPHNTPEQRLAAAAGVFTTTDVMTLANANQFERGDCRGMVRTMCTGRFLGRGRAAAVLTNVIVPWALAENRIDEVPSWLPAEDISHPVRQMAYRLFGRDHNPTAFYANNGLCIQGLIQLYRDCRFSDAGGCDTCSISPQIPAKKSLKYPLALLGEVLV